MSRSPKTGTKIVLFTVGIALIIIAVIVVLRGLGILSAIPDFIIWALVLLTLGIGIIGGLVSQGN
ncbi:MAG: hypothetical protein VKK42_08570 [Lyngbya sp.]|nr:hypothetical protein [Lyngbya sp.]